MSDVATTVTRHDGEKLTLAEITDSWSVVKRTGEQQKFDYNKIIQAVSRCFTNQLELPLSESVETAKVIAAGTVNLLAGGEESSFSIETVQDAVIRTLWVNGQYEAATQYTLYREMRRQERVNKPIDANLERLFAKDAEILRTPAQMYQFVSKFARWKEEDKRRETWSEAIDRVFNWFETLPHYAKLAEEEKTWLKTMMFEMKATSSLRVLQMAGPALERCHMGVYNCAGLPIVDLFAFAELLYILMQGSGCGFSVESDFVTRLPRVRKQKKGKAEVYVIEDTTEGWCDALHTGLKTWFGGYDVTYDVTKLRLKGTRLKTKGGLASGPEPLLELLAFVRKTILAAQGRRLTDLECHDICCKIAKIVQVGGVRRASTISLSDLHSESMRRAKHGDWYVDNQQRAMANNSSVYEKRPDIYTFMSEFKALVDSRSGERGIFNRGAARRLRPARRKNARFIVNPCAEIVFRPFGLCNLSIAVAREDDTVETLIEKVRAAAYFGKIQSLCTNFNYVRPAWKKNAEEELLLGVDVTGHADCPLLRFGAPNRAELLRKLRETVAEVDASLSPRFGCGLSAANTTIKPAGDSSELFACASGASPRFGAQQIRRFRESKISPVANFLIASGVPHETAMEDDGLWAFSFPKKAPVGSTLREDMSAADQIHNWLEWKGNYAEHSVSVTVYVKDHEWPEVQSLVWKHFDEITCLSFLPWDNGSYRTVPNEVLTIEEYEKFAATFPELHWAKLSQYEVEDSTYMNRAMACKGDNCEL